MLPWRLSIMELKRLVSASRRLSCEEGRLLVGTSSVWFWDGNSEIGGFSDCEEDLGSSDGFEESDGGLEGSAKSLVWVWILHCRQVDVLNEGRLDVRRVREAEGGAIDSKISRDRE